MKRRDFLSQFAGYSTALATTTAWGQPATEQIGCVTDLSVAYNAFRTQSASNDDDDEDESESQGMTWQGVAHETLVWRPQDVRINRDGTMYLAVGFVYEPGPNFIEQVMTRARRWMQSDALSSEIQFHYDPHRPIDQCEIRVASSRSSGVSEVNVSQLGRKAKDRQLAPSMDTRQQATMIIHDISAVEHEFGHVLGLGHEATHPHFRPTLRMERLYWYYDRDYGWDAPRTDQNFIATPSCDGDPSFNPASVMLYPLPADTTSLNVEFSDFHNIHPRDLRCAESLYQS